MASKLYGVFHVLPKSITKLVNLQTLDLSFCISLQELPKNVSKLLDLRVLNLTNCLGLSDMPLGMGSLTHLHTLGLFVVGRKSLQGKQCIVALDGLRSMSNHKGFLEVRIWVHKIANYVKEDHGEGAYLSNKERLKEIHIIFRSLYYFGPFSSMENIPLNDMECAQLLLEEMQPHHDLKELKLDGHIGEIMPRWPMREDNSTLFYLPNLVTLNISNCLLLRCLPSLGELPHLKELTLENLPKVEYVVDAKPEASGLCEGSTLCPNLQKLNIIKLPNFKGWWPRLGLDLQKKQHIVVSVPVPCFAQLKYMYICYCPKLESYPVCSSMKTVIIRNSPEATEARVWDNTQSFLDFLLIFTGSDLKSRMISIDEFESDMENKNIDTKLTNALHHLLSRRGCNSLGVPCDFVTIY